MEERKISRMLDRRALLSGCVTWGVVFENEIYTRAQADVVFLLGKKRKQVASSILF